MSMTQHHCDNWNCWINPYWARSGHLEDRFNEHIKFLIRGSCSSAATYKLYSIMHRIDLNKRCQYLLPEQFHIRNVLYKTKANAAYRACNTMLLPFWLHYQIFYWYFCLFFKVLWNSYYFIWYSQKSFNKAYVFIPHKQGQIIQIHYIHVVSAFSSFVVLSQSRPQIQNSCFFLS